MDGERLFRRSVLVLGVAALVCGVLSLTFAGAPSLSGQLIVGAVVLALAVFVLIAASGFFAAYGQMRHRRNRNQA